MKASDYIARALEAEGVRHVFEVSGGMITHLLDSLHTKTSVKIVSVHHEQAAAFAAEAAGRITGVPGVAMATSGPGAINLLTGVGSCYFDSSPAVFITGQVNRAEQKRQRAVRQLGFQETEIVAMVAPITKAAWKIGSAEELPERLRQAFAVARHGRPGPVLLDIPMDVQREQVNSEVPEAAAQPDDCAAAPGQVRSTIQTLLEASRPLVLAGGGIRSSRSAAEFRAFAEALGVPVVHSLMGVDVLPSGHPLRVGMIGTYGNRWANNALAASDCLLVLGSRLDVRQTGADTEAFGAGKTIIHVDCDPAEINNRVASCVAVVSSLPRFFDAALAVAREFPAVDRKAWSGQISGWREKWPDTAELAGTPGINPNVFMHVLSSRSESAAAFVVDVGQHQMWAAQSLDLSADQRFLTSGGMGSMGFGLPAAVGAAFATGSPVVVVAGDGAFQCNIQELQTVTRNRLPLKIVVVNNHCHGMVRQFQESYFGARYQSTLWGYSAPDFASVARGYGLGAEAVHEEKDLDAAVARLWDDPNAPALLEVVVDTFANAYPKIAFGRPITDMEPFAKPVEMEST